VIAGLPIAVCDDQARAREVAETMFGVYRNIPAYSRMLERGEAQSPADVALVGTEAQLAHRIEAFGSAGVTDLCAFVFHVSDDTRVRTEAFLESLC
jgi:alkanesulfonate monooxygenase SsuD/methylene tetrahydromethanopterin reductase-like flavin-dependent oxidoreductase (luciferase family)